MMGAKEWLATYYPAPASEVHHEQALAHSLRKWEGLRPEVLKEHGLRSNGYYLYGSGSDSSILMLGESSCTLCASFYNDHDRETPCAACPLAIARGGVPCDELMEGEGSSPWGHFAKTQDPEYMIGWLRRALEAQGAPA